MAKGPKKKVVKKPARSARPATKHKAAPAKVKAPVAKAKLEGTPIRSIKATVVVPSRFASPPPQAPVSTVRSPSVEAVTAYERGIAALHNHDYKTASTTFKALLDQFPTEGFLTDRARVYLELAARELGRRPSGGGSVEERLTAATLALNNNNDAEAARLAADVLKEDRSQDLAAYLLAVVAARRGDVETALTHLRNAINLNPECRLQARQDEEFDPLMDSDDFHALIEAPTSPAAQAAAAQPRKPARKTGR
jgi:tetratricopeptide (TPR) repeat protein